VRRCGSSSRAINMGLQPLDEYDIEEINRKLPQLIVSSS
jgi:hypothetical protein